MGDAVITLPYRDAADVLGEWVVTLARSVYSDCTGGKKLGVIAVDVLLDQIQESIEETNFLNNGYSILATEGNGTYIALVYNLMQTATENRTNTKQKLWKIKN